MTEAEAMAVLVISGVGYAHREEALKKAGSAKALLQEPGAYAAQLGEAGIAAVLRAVRGKDASLERMERENVKLIVRGESEYPERLAQIAQPPHVLFAWGAANLQDRFPFAIVGTRRASAYGERQTRAIARDLAAAGVCIVSGLALGIDAAAHDGALLGHGRTVAVLGGALDRFYPEENRALMHRILGAGGSVVTEYPLGMRPARYSFLRRNRIIAGLSLGVLVTEGASRSGALRTAQDALEEGREVFALPGSVESVGSQLPHMLIADGAHLVTEASDILDALVIEPGRETMDAARRRGRPKDGGKAALIVPQGIGEREAAVCRVLLCGQADFDTLCEATGIESSELGAMLSDMEMEGMIEAVSGLLYAPGEAMRPRRQ